jgi:hypothetical protein
MDDRQFETLTRRLGTGWRPSRRAAVAALLAAVIPRAAAAQCGNPCGQDRCGAVRDACGQEVNCGSWCQEEFVPGNDCMVGVCGADGYCHFVAKPNETLCWGEAQIGICCDGECLRGPCL